jgi:hypothetical protein
MTALEHLVEMRRDQALRVANASRGKRHTELERYPEIESWIAVENAHASTGAETSLSLFEP